MISPTPSTTEFRGTHVLAVLAAILGIGTIAISVMFLTQGYLPFGGPVGLVALVALVLGFLVYRRNSPYAADRYLAATGMISGVLVMTFPFWLVLLPVAIISVPFWYWHSARKGWRWWAATASITLGALLIGQVLVSLMLLVLGTGDPYYNIPRWTGFSVQLLDYLSVAGVAVIASGVTGLFVTRRLGASVVAALVGFVAISLAWWLIVQPVHTNEETWMMPTGMFIGFGLLIMISTLVVARLLRAPGDTASHA
jgi:hypothetical protein